MEKETFEILQVMPAPPGWAIRWHYGNDYCWSWPMAIALYEYRCGNDCTRHVGPVDEDGDMAIECKNYVEFEHVGDTLPERRPVSPPRDPIHRAVRDAISRGLNPRVQVLAAEAGGAVTRCRVVCDPAPDGMQVIPPAWKQPHHDQFAARLVELGRVEFIAADAGEPGNGG